MSPPVAIEPKPLTTTELTEIADRIRTRIRRTAEDIIGVGQDLITVKAQLGHGRFLEWIDREFGMTDRTARKYMQVTAWAEGKSESVSDLPVSTLYLLAAPSAPPEVADDVIAQAEAGETIKTAEVKRRIKEAQQSVKPEPEGAEDEEVPFWETAEYKQRNELKNACLILAVQCYEAARMEIPPLDAEWRAALIDLIEKAVAPLSDLRVRIEQQNAEPPPMVEHEQDQDDSHEDDPLVIPDVFKRARSS